ncbi:MAG TPA: hypothetical protein VN541_09515 [Tepidisphaeraceae bacterium]|nr:hypothetical protein [Tepidisphaeraceae bacterium]
MHPLHIPSTGGKKLNVLGIPMMIRVHGRQTLGGVSAVESHDVPAGGLLRTSFCNLELT